MKRQRLAAHQARQLGAVVVIHGGFGLQKSIAFSLIEHQAQGEYGGVVAHTALQLEQCGPQCGVFFAVDDALEQRYDHGRQIVLRRWGRRVISH